MYLVIFKDFSYIFMKDIGLWFLWFVLSGFVLRVDSWNKLGTILFSGGDCSSWY